MSHTLESLRSQLESDDLGLRMKALSDSRTLSPAERFEIVTLAVADRHSRIRYDAVSQLSSIGTQDLDVSLTLLSDRLLQDPEVDVRAAAADSIGALKLTSAFDSLRHAYESSDDWMMQFSVIAALGELGDPRGFEVLSGALTHENDLVRIAAIGALGDLGNPTAVDLLLPFAEDPDWQIRHRVVQALAQLGGDRAKTTLQVLAQDPNQQVAEVAKLQLAST